MPLPVMKFISKQVKVFYYVFAVFCKHATTVFLQKKYPIVCSKAPIIEHFELTDQ